MITIVQHFTAPHDRKDHQPVLGLGLKYLGSEHYSPPFIDEVPSEGRASRSFEPIEETLRLPALIVVDAALVVGLCQRAVIKANGVLGHKESSKEDIVLVVNPAHLLLLALAGHIVNGEHVLVVDIVVGYSIGE